jgi:hypothetical protein
MELAIAPTAGHWSELLHPDQVESGRRHFQ